MTMSFITDKDLEYMQLALERARLAPALGEVPIGAVLVLDGQVLAQVHNFREVWQDPTAHAEIVAIREAATRLGTWRLTGTTLYVTIEPCSMCAGAIIQSRITRLVFGAKDPKAGACGSVFNLPDERRLNHKVQVLGGVLERESQDLIQTFFRRLRDDVEERAGGDDNSLFVNR
jgi:tRNA(adenine34) deaminase